MPLVNNKVADEGRAGVVADGKALVDSLMRVSCSKYEATLHYVWPLIINAASSECQKTVSCWHPRPLYYCESHLMFYVLKCNFTCPGAKGALWVNGIFWATASVGTSRTMAEGTSSVVTTTLLCKLHVSSWWLHVP